MDQKQNSWEINTGTDYSLVTQLFDAQPDAVIWLIPVFEGNNKAVPVDFQMGYCNAAACYALKTSKQDIIGATLKSTALMNEAWRNTALEHCLKVWATNTQLESTYFNEETNKYFNVARSKVMNGILSITRDRTQLMKAHEAHQEQSQLLSQLIDAAPYGVSLYESMRNSEGKITDFKLKLCNKKCSEITALSYEDLHRYTVKELMVIRGHSNYFDMCSKVVETGEPVYLEYFSKVREQWVGFSIVKFNDGYLLNYIDITQTKGLEQKAVEQAEMLQSVLDASVTGLYAVEAITGYSGKVLDFKITMFNKACEKLFGLKPGDINKTYLSLFPAAISNGLFNLHLKALEEKESFKTEFHYKSDRFDRWYSISFAKKGDRGLVLSYTEINEPNKKII